MQPPQCDQLLFTPPSPPLPRQHGAGAAQRMLWLQPPNPQLGSASGTPALPILVYLSSYFLHHRKARELSTGWLLGSQFLFTLYRNDLIGNKIYLRKYFTTHRSFTCKCLQIYSVLHCIGFWPVQSNWKHTDVLRFLQNNRKSDELGFRQ